MWEDDMAAKSATKKHAKILPIGSGDALAVAAELDNRSDTGAGRIDLKTLADPDAVRELVGGLSDVPAIDDESGEPAAEFGEAFGSTARAVESVGMVQTVAHSGAQPANASARELPAFDLQALRERIAACRDQDTLDALVDEARGQPPEVASLISADYERRSAELANPTPAGGASPQAAAASAASSARTSVPAARRGGSTPVQGTIE
jgi:type IV secretory pathway VirJ component